MLAPQSAEHTERPFKQQLTRTQEPTRSGNKRYALARGIVKGRVFAPQGQRALCDMLDETARRSVNPGNADGTSTWCFPASFVAKH
jgi:hypothetical protein